MIKENIVLPATILVDDRHFTYQERMFIYFWASRSLSHQFSFTLAQYANFRGFQLQSCSSNLRTVLKRLHKRAMLEFSMSKGNVLVSMDPSFQLNANSPTVYINKNEINALPSVIALRIFEMLVYLTLNSFCVSMKLDHFKTKIGIEPGMYGSNLAFYNRLVKPSLKKISECTKINVQSELLEQNLVLYVVVETATSPRVTP